MRAAVLLLLAALSVACNRETSDADATASAERPQKAASAGEWIGKSSDGREVLRVALAGGQATVGCNGKTLQADNKGDKRRYREGSTFVAEVKAKDEGFKLRREDGSLLWKIKLSDDKIKIGPEEEGDPPYVIKDKGGKHEVEDQGKRVGMVELKGGAATVEDASGSERFSGNQPSALWGVLLLEAIPEQQRCVIAAELATRGQ